MESNYYSDKSSAHHDPVQTAETSCINQKNTDVTLCGCEINIRREKKNNPNRKTDVSAVK